ncbi:hypothetical protein JCM11251_004490 [Rhodosporidiobolus azoricus]
MQGYHSHDAYNQGHYPLPHPSDPASQHHHHHQQHQPPPPSVASTSTGAGNKRKAAQAGLQQGGPGQGEDDDDEKPGSEAGSTGNGGAAAKSKGGASEFVKKLYKMLDDGQYHDVVSWGHDGTSFVVKDMNQFTTNILPSHFKHSNFASFVRQLNKYDFHKVKNSEEGPSPYGENTWEFRHPNFRADMKDNLENIKRKAPSSKKAAAQSNATRGRAGASGNGSVDPSHPSGSSGLGSGEYASLQGQLDNLSRTQVAMQQHMTNLSQDYQAVIGEMMNFQRNMVAQDQLMQNLIQYLVNLEADQKGTAAQDPSAPFVPSSQAQKLISSYTEVARASYDQMADLTRRASLSGGGFNNLPPLPPPPPTFGHFDFQPHQQQQGRDGPPGGQQGQGGPQQQQGGDGRPASSTRQTGQGQQGQGGPTSQPVQQQGSGGQMPPPPPPQFVHPAYDQHPPPPHSSAPPAASNPTSSSSASDRPGAGPRRQSNVPGWAVPPRVLLVEDDAVCRKLSAKFLEVFGCQIDVATDGAMAVQKMNMQKYDLVLMDIVMPNLDGVSATSMIRQFDSTTPIVSMTSNSGPNDLLTYFSHGMNDILPKPFTKENLHDILNKHLEHLKLFQQMAEIPRALGFTNNQIQEALAQSVVGVHADPNHDGPADPQAVFNPFSSVGISDHAYVEMLQGIALEKEGRTGLEVINGDGNARFVTEGVQ